MTYLTNQVITFRERPMQPVGLRDSSRGVEHSDTPRIRRQLYFDPGRVTELGWHPFRCESLIDRFRGAALRFDPRLLSGNPSGLRTWLICQVCRCPNQSQRLTPVVLTKLAKRPTKSTCFASNGCWERNISGRRCSLSAQRRSLSSPR
jgi:hypothetical protein